MNLTFLIFSAVIIISVNGFVAHNNECRNDLPVYKNLDLQKLVGFWYRYSRFQIPKLFSYADNRCATMNITLGEHPKTILSTETSIFDWDEPTRVFQNGNGEMKTDGIITVSYNKNLPNYNYQIVDGDFSNFVTIYYCIVVEGEATLEELLVITRDSVIGPEIKTHIENLYAKHFPNYELQKIMQDPNICSIDPKKSRMFGDE